jgi:endonuclease/exonuclease/phosphatase family metal-dependent hydrolase
VRQRQSVAILRLLEQDPRPRLLLGDLNDDPDSLPVRLLRRELTDVFAASGQGPSGTYPLPLFLPTLRIDYVLADGAFAACNSRVLRVGASDHYPVIADVHLKAQPVAHHASRQGAAAGTVR